jgi:hypothetical protein
MLNALFIAGLAKQMAETDTAKTASQAASRAAAEVQSRNESIQFDIEKLFMITEALWNIFKDQCGYTDEHLIQMIRDIDLCDGKLDGKVAKSTEPRTCTQCSRTIMRNQLRCIYCGAEAPQKPFER